MADVGIVMPVYKQVHAYLEAAILSVLSQTYTSFRLIIVIDGAPEMEPLVRPLVKRDSRVQIISYARNRGVSSALNRGFDILKLDRNIHYWTWVSSDNTYHPRFLEVLRNALVKGPESLGLVYSSFHSIDDQGERILDDKSLMHQRQYQAQPKEELLNGSIVGVSFMYKAIYAKMIEGYKMEPVEDYEYWLRLTERCDIRFIPVELMNYRVDSKLSVSATLKSIASHRRWRYAFHLARHEARRRRGIQPELTVLYPASQSNPAVIERVENLYEQVFSNYHFYVLDLSPDQQVTNAVSQVSHPTTDFRAMTGKSAAAAIAEMLPQIQTPYVLILGEQNFKDVQVIQILLQQLRRSGENMISSYYTADHTDVGYRSVDHLQSRQQYTEELFKTEALRTYKDVLLK